MGMNRLRPDFFNIRKNVLVDFMQNVFFCFNAVKFLL